MLIAFAYLCLLLSLAVAPAGVRLVSESEEQGDLPEEQEPSTLCNAQPYQLPATVRRAGGGLIAGGSVGEGGGCVERGNK